MADETTARYEPVFLDAEVALQRIAALTTAARTTWLVLLGFLAFIGLTLLSVRDVDFFSVRAETDLPIVDIAIPTTTFLWTAALLAAVLHGYLHVLLVRLWDALAEAPPRVGSVRLGDRVFPWLVNDWALRRRKDQPVTRRPLDLLGSVVTGLVVWLAAPIVLAFFWWRSLPAHDARLSLAIAAALLVALLASLRGWRRARTRLARPGLWVGRRGRRRRGFWARIESAAQGLGVVVLWLAMAASVPLLFLATIAGAGGHHLPPVVEATLAESWPTDWGTVPVVRANLVDAEIAIKPDDWRDPEVARQRFLVDWCRDNGIPAHACATPVHADQVAARRRWCDDLGIEDCIARFGEFDAAFEAQWAIERAAYIADIRGPDLRGRDLRKAEARGAFLVGVDLRGARLEGANLDGAWLEDANLLEARLEEASLSGAGLERANLREAELEKANLAGAHLEGASLFEAGLERADLGVAWLEGANLYRAELGGADLTGAELREASLLEARLEVAILKRADLGDANLSRAWLMGANLWRARLEGANLGFAQLEGADLREAQLQFAEWVGARIGPSVAHSADFTGGKNLTQSQLDLVIGNDATVLPRDAQTDGALHVWSCWEEDVAELYLAMLAEIANEYHQISEKKLRERMSAQGFLCGPDNPRRPVGMLAEDVIEGHR